jgi:hypothetical protein
VTLSDLSKHEDFVYKVTNFNPSLRSIDTTSSVHTRSPCLLTYILQFTYNTIFFPTCDVSKVFL